MSIDYAIELVEQVVRTQGVRFMKEFLRRFASKQVRVGNTKEEIAANMIRALRDGHIPPEELAEWVSAIEGWGSQHIYLYGIPVKSRTMPIWNADRLRASAVADRFAWSSTTDLAFTETLEPARMHYDGRRLEMVWQKSHENRKREQARDRKAVIQGDLYRFDAYRVVPTRSLVRFVAVPKQGVAAISVQIPLGDEHRRATAMVRETVAKILAFDAHFRPVNLSRVIMKLDQASLNAAGAGFVSRRTKFQKNTVTIEFEAAGDISPWEEQSVRDVRRTLDPGAFGGHSGKFSARLDQVGEARRVEMTLDHRMGRIYFRAQMSRDEVWDVLRKLKGAEAR